MTDPSALLGRMDVQVEFKLATRPQARDLFLHFFPDTSASDLADQFSESIPNQMLSIATIQGYLMEHRRDPKEAVEQVNNWVRQH